MAASLRRFTLASRPILISPTFSPCTQLTEATKANGAVQIVRGSHHRGLLSRRGHTLSPELVASICDAHPEDVVDLELKPGEAGERDGAGSS